MASQLSAPPNGGPSQPGFTQAAQGYTPPSNVVHPPGGDFVLDMSPNPPAAEFSAPAGEFATPEPEAPPAPPPKKVTRKRPARKKAAAKKSAKS